MHTGKNSTQVGGEKTNEEQKQGPWSNENHCSHSHLFKTDHFVTVVQPPDRSHHSFKPLNGSRDIYNFLEGHPHCFLWLCASK